MNVYEDIKKDKQVIKFCLYGFFKDLTFFEPYLIIFLMAMQLNLFEIGLLMAIREAMMYLFEVPSGIIADHYGKKKELMMCFVFYMIAFVLFFLSDGFWTVAIGMVFYGLGEAFRSGTHKAMILSYLEQKGWFEHKGFVYGRTRSFSLLGSSLSAFMGILFILNLPAMKWIFLLSVVPYILDFLLIASYPESLDEPSGAEKSLKNFIHISKSQLSTVFKNANLNKIVLSSASYDGIFKTIKDYIQPIMNQLILAAGVGTLMTFDADQSLKIYLGVTYGIFYIFSSRVSKNIYKMTVKYSAIKVFNIAYDIFGISLICLAWVIANHWLFASIGIYFVLYLMMDARRPVFVDASSDFIEKKQRATVLSIESQMRAILMVVMAPLFGWIAVHFSISVLFLGIGVLLLLTNRFLNVKPPSSHSDFST